MRQVPIPNNTSAHRFGVELDKTLGNGEHALGIVEITDTPSPYEPGRILIRVNAWQVTPDGRPIIINDVAGRAMQRKIREMVISVARDEYNHVVAEQQITVAAVALEMVADEIPAAPAPLPPVEIDAAPAPAPAP
jgi:hypothetical protein